jgi:hypothetical protein
MKYRKKPVEIEAVQWTGNNLTEIKTFMNNTDIQGDSNNNLFIATLEGVMTASVNDFIIKGVKGEYYPCKPDIFIATYEEVI